MHGAAELSFRRVGAATRLATLYHQAPLRVLFPAAEEPGLAPAVLVTTSGGLAGGDRLDVRVTARDGAALQVTTQAAEKVYRSTGADSLVEIDLAAEEGAWLEWLPQETILFDRSRLSRRTRIEAAPGARVLASEILVFGRRARGERLCQGLIREAWEVRRGGRLIWADALAMSGDLAATLAAPACFAAAAAVATLLYVGADAADALTLARDLTAGGGEGEIAAATCVGGVLVLRWLAHDARALRDAFARVWSALRHRLGGWAPALPRVWAV